MGMSLSKLQELGMDREARRAGSHGVTKSRTQLSNWTELNCIQINSRSCMAQKDWKFTFCSHNILKSANSYTDQLSSMQSFRNSKTDGFYLQHVTFKNALRDISITSFQRRKIPGGESWADWYGQAWKWCSSFQLTSQ